MCAVHIKMEEGEVGRRLEEYLASCEKKGEGDEDEGKDEFPNLAGYCRYCGFGLAGFAALRQRWPDACDYVLAVLEDCALRTDKPAALVGLYLKRRMEYDAEFGKGAGEGEKVIFVDKDFADDGE